MPNVPIRSAASCIYVIFFSWKHPDADHVSAWLYMAVPTTMTSDFSEGNTCTALDPCFISRLARSLFQCEGGESSYACASGSASSGSPAAFPHAVAH